MPATTLATTLERSRLDGLVDLAAYPIDRLGDAAGLELVERCRRELAATGCLVLKRFVPEAALGRLTLETERLSPRAHMNETATNPYNSAGDPDLPPEHPKNRFADRTNGFVAGDRIDDATMIRRIYHDPGFKAFVAAIVGEPLVHEFADPLADLVVNVLPEGCQHPWHFDSNDYIVTLQTRRPEGGGRFEYAPGIRGTHGESFEAVQRLLDGDREGLVSIALEPGDLQVFFGRNSLHRVTPVEGPHERHTVIFAYARQPGFVGQPERARRIFGRMAPIHEEMLARGVTRADHLAD